MKIQQKQILVWLVLFVLMITTFNIFQGDNFGGRVEKLAFSDFLNRVDDKQVNSVIIDEQNISGMLSSGMPFSTYAAKYPGLIDRLSANGVYIEVSPPDTRHWLFNIFIYWFPTLLLVGVWLFAMRQMQGGGKGLGLGKSKARLVSEKGPKVMFKDVAGIDDAKEELGEIVDFLRMPGKFQNLGGKIPKGCLLIGPPGTGKTLLAKSIAGEANVPFFSISGSDFVEMFVGVGASRVRDMFEQGKRNAPCIIFIDEIDAVGRHRGMGMGGGNDEREQTLNQMLVEMDGFDTNEGVVIIAATNRPDVLDPALLRPGRFDRQITVSPPDIKGREQILNVHAKKIKYSKDVDLSVLARGTPGFTGADLANLINEAALIAARRSKKVVDNHDIDEARDKVLMGPERRSMIMTKKELKNTAYHESGHALVTLYAPGAHPIHKATIIPRGRALGMVQQLPETDQVSQTYQQYKSNIAIAMGGKAAEEIINGFEGVTSGPVSDIQQATKIARAMVNRFGLSDKVGPVDYTAEHGVEPRVSQKTQELIDSEVKRLLDEGYEFAKNILKNNIDQLHLLTETLMEKETLTGKQIKHLLLGNEMDSKEDPVFPAKITKKKSKSPVKTKSEDKLDNSEMKKTKDNPKKS